MVLVFLIPGSHNVHRWIRFGGHFTFQPSEIAKPVLVLSLIHKMCIRDRAIEAVRQNERAGASS